MAKLSNLLQTSERFRRDLLVGLGIWICLEVIAFGLLPGVGMLQPGDRQDTWLLVSLLLGFSGVLILALCPQLIEHAQKIQNRWLRSLIVLVWRILAWLGLAGIAFPLLMISFEAFTALFMGLISNS